MQKCLNTWKTQKASHTNIQLLWLVPSSVKVAQKLANQKFLHSAKCSQQKLQERNWRVAFLLQNNAQYGQILCTRSSQVVFQGFPCAGRTCKSACILSHWCHGWCRWCWASRITSFHQLHALFTQHIDRGACDGLGEHCLWWTLHHTERLKRLCERWCGLWTVCHRALSIHQFAGCVCCWSWQRSFEGHMWGSVHGDEGMLCHWQSSSVVGTRCNSSVGAGQGGSSSCMSRWNCGVNIALCHHTGVHNHTALKRRHP